MGNAIEEFSVVVSSWQYHPAVICYMRGCHSEHLIYTAGLQPPPPQLPHQVPSSPFVFASGSKKYCMRVCCRLSIMFSSVKSVTHETSGTPLTDVEFIATVGSYSVTILVRCVVSVSCLFCGT